MPLLFTWLSYIIFTLFTIQNAIKEYKKLNGGMSDCNCSCYSVDFTAYS